MNILITSVGTRNKIVQYFKQELHGNGLIVATDCSPYAPALYEADKIYLVPKIHDSDYITTLLKICDIEKINAVLSLIDPELSILARNSELFKNKGVKLINSSYDLCELALDKWKMYNWLTDHNFKCAKSYLDRADFLNDLKMQKIQFPVFVKPVCGSASIAISKVNDIDTLNMLLDENSELMIQEYLVGEEIGADCYVDMISGEVISIFTKRKIKMRSGETDKSISFIDHRLNALIKDFLKQSGFIGLVDIDIFLINGEYYISEINPRFGGGYPHAHACGCNHVAFILSNLNGKKNVPSIGNYQNNIVMMKYNEISVMKLGEMGNENTHLIQ